VQSRQDVRGGRVLELEHATVCAQQREVAALLPGGQEGLAQGGHIHAGRGKVLRVPTQDECPRYAEESARRRVGVHEAAPVVDQEDPVQGGVEDCTKQALALPELLAGLVEQLSLDLCWLFPPFRAVETRCIAHAAFSQAERSKRTRA
jgi:hypothetical protein